MKKNSLPIQTQKYNKQSVETLSVKYGFTKQFIRQCLRGDRTSLTAITIKDEYKQITRDLESVITKHAHTVSK